MKNCLLNPIPEIFDATNLLNEAADFHLAGDQKNAEILFKKVDIPVIKEWTESIWGKGGIYSRHLKRLGNPPKLIKELLDDNRMPNKNGEKELLDQDGHFCSFLAFHL